MCVECVCSFHFNKSIVYRYSSDWHLIQINYPFIVKPPHLATSRAQTRNPMKLDSSQSNGRRRKEQSHKIDFVPSCVRSEYVKSTICVTNGSVFILETIVLYLFLDYSTIHRTAKPLSKRTDFSTGKSTKSIKNQIFPNLRSIEIIHSFVVFIVI